MELFTVACSPPRQCRPSFQQHHSSDRLQTRPMLDDFVSKHTECPCCTARCKDHKSNRAALCAALKVPHSPAPAHVSNLQPDLGGSLAAYRWHSAPPQPQDETPPHCVTAVVAWHQNCQRIGLPQPAPTVRVVAGPQAHFLLLLPGARVFGLGASLWCWCSDCSKRQRSRARCLECSRL